MKTRNDGPLKRGEKFTRLADLCRIPPIRLKDFDPSVSPIWETCESFVNKFLLVAGSLNLVR